jgi:hypothetical protein
MKAAIGVCLLIAGVMLQAAPRETVYGGAVVIGGQVVPLFQNGYLIYLHRPNRLQVFRPDTQLAYEYEVPCPSPQGNCSVTSVTVTRKGIVALGIAYPSPTAYASGIRFVDQAGKEIRFVETGRYVPGQLAFDKNDNLWSIGWERDKWINGRESEEAYNLVRKYSADGKLIGEYLPKTLWESKHNPYVEGRGYWKMYAADDRIGVVVNENFDKRIAEWVEWDLNGTLLQRIPLRDDISSLGRAFCGNGKLYAQFRVAERANQSELRVLEGKTGKWLLVRANLPEQVVGYLLGADGDQLVYRVAGGGNLRLVWARPE